VAPTRRALHRLVLRVHDLALATARDRGRRDHKAGYGRHSDARDFHRFWGAALLPNDPAASDNPFRDPAFLLDAHRELSRVTTTREGFHSPTDSRQRFERALGALAPRLRLFAVTESATDAVNLCFDIAAHCGRRRLAPRAGSRAVPSIAFFDGVYGGAHGLAVGMPRFGLVPEHGRHRTMQHLRLPDTSTLEWPRQSRHESRRLDAAEARALAKLKRLATNRTRPIGAVLLETIQGVSGVRHHRRGFLLRLRKLADRYGIPIIVDETLTGGGRTGRFFAYEHYRGFTPDFVVFGKGLLLGGVAAVRRSGQRPSQLPPESIGVTTFWADNLRLLRAAHVLDAIRRRRLLENAATVGRYLARKLRALDHELKLGLEISGIGLLLGLRAPADLLKIAGTVFTTDPDRRRLLPRLTLSKRDVDEFVGELRRRLQRRGHYRS
jgi:4-aminobutyrate aminotransferase-like enzyme